MRHASEPIQEFSQSAGSLGLRGRSNAMNGNEISYCNHEYKWTSSPVHEKVAAPKFRFWLRLRRSYRCEAGPVATDTSTAQRHCPTLPLLGGRRTRPPVSSSYQHGLRNSFPPVAFLPRSARGPSTAGAPFHAVKEIAITTNWNLHVAQRSAFGASSLLLSSVMRGTPLEWQLNEPCFRQRTVLHREDSAHDMGTVFRNFRNTKRLFSPLEWKNGVKLHYR